MNTLEQAWQNSPARPLSYADHLPTYTNEAPKYDIFATEKQRQDAALAIVALSAQQFGRASSEREPYFKTAGDRYAGVRFLAGTRELYLLQQQIEANNVSIDQQNVEVKQAIISDIAGLRQLSEQHLGRPDKNRFNAIMARAHRDAHATFDMPDVGEDIKLAARRVLERFPQGEPELIDQYVCEVSNELADHWYPALAEKYHSFIELVEPDKVYNSEAMAQLFERALVVMCNEWALPNAARWRAQLWDGNSFNIDHTAKSIRIPSDTINTSNQAINLLVHEAGVHLLRRLNGEKTGDLMLASGMPGYIEDEEALADVLGQIASQKLDKDFLVYDAAIGLARFEPRLPLAQLEDYIVDLEMLQVGRSLEENELLRLKKRVHRVTRGMPSFYIDGELHQVTYNADLKYTRALPKAVSFLEQHRNSPAQALEWVMGGKFAYSNAEHVEYYSRRAWG